MKKMSMWGSGIKIVGSMVFLSIVFISIEYFFIPEINIPIKQTLALVIGGIWFLLGFPLWLLSALVIKKNFEAKRLMNSGIYKHIQHPMYSAFILFFFPAISFGLQSSLGFLSPIIGYLVFRKTIQKEEIYLSEEFGKEYEDYRKSTPYLFPYTIFFVKNKS
jgi:protein-S-isoprenylcysteine O-methyltransferase Ste14